MLYIKTQRNQITLWHTNLLASSQLLFLVKSLVSFESVGNIFQWLTTGFTQHMPTCCELGNKYWWSFSISSKCKRNILQMLPCLIIYRLWNKYLWTKHFQWKFVVHIQILHEISHIDVNQIRIANELIIPCIAQRITGIQKEKKNHICYTKKNVSPDLVDVSKQRWYSNSLLI